MTNEQQPMRPEDAAVSHIAPTAEEQPAKDAKQLQEEAKSQKDKDDKGAVGLDALNP